MVNNKLWIPVEDFALARGVSVTSLLRFLSQFQIAPVFDVDGVQCLLSDDAYELTSLVDACSDALDFLPTTGAQIRHQKGVEVWLSQKASDCKSIGVALRNLWKRLDEEDSFGTLSVEFIAGSTVRCASENIVEFIASQMERIQKTSSGGASVFSRSVSYLGSKQPILDFVVEVVSRYTSGETKKLLDVMCGSGVVSAATSRLLCETYASDALEFCSNLAITISNTVDPRRLSAWRNQLLPLYEENYKALSARLEFWASHESELLVADPKLTVESYRTFVSSFPRYPTRTSSGWNPEEFVNRARMYNGTEPYGLITAYFANAYFGVRQSIELDSIRFAIDKINASGMTKKHLLGALAITASRMASNYGGHFAQPRYVVPDSITIGNIGRLFDLRARSIWHEFLIRLEVLGASGNGKNISVHTLPGPWQRALLEYGKIAVAQDVVYLDPPYTREEASRYYHLLETLTRYNYPESKGKALAPPKGKDRFDSEFFTRSSSIFSERLACLLSQPIESGYIVLWSYCDNALCSVPEIINNLDVEHLRASGYLTRHVHKGQGKGRHRVVEEYIVAMSTQRNET